MKMPAKPDNFRNKCSKEEGREINFLSFLWTHLIPDGNLFVMCQLWKKFPHIPESVLVHIASTVYDVRLALRAHQQQSSHSVTFACHRVPFRCSQPRSISITGHRARGHSKASPRCAHVEASHSRQREERMVLVLVLPMLDLLLLLLLPVSDLLLLLTPVLSREVTTGSTAQTRMPSRNLAN